ENGQPTTPFKRLYELVREYNITIGMVDAQPNTNGAQEFARFFPGKIFLAWYGEAPGPDQIKWWDKMKMKEQIRKGGKEIKLKWQCTLSRYSSLDMTLRQFSESMIIMPHPDKLVQLVRNEESGRFEAENIVRTRTWKHLCSM